jgi:integrase
VAYGTTCGCGRPTGGYKRTFRIRKEAETFRAHELADQSRGGWVDPARSSVTLGVWAAEWLESDPGKRASTLARDESALRLHVLPALGERPLASITPSDIQHLVGRWSARGAPRTVRRQYDVLRALLRAAVEADRFVRSPCRGIKLPAPPALGRPQLRAEDLAALALAVGPDYTAMVWLGAVLGLRWGECAGLRVGRIDFANRRLAVVEQAMRVAHGRIVFGPPKSEAGRRTLSLPAGLVDLLATHLARRRLDATGADALVFTSPTGEVLDDGHWRRRVWVPACRLAGLVGVTFHDSRRANATALVAEGVDLKTAQTRLGHSDPRLTLAVYAQATTEGDRQAADQVAARLMAAASADAVLPVAVSKGCAMDVPSAPVRGRLAQVTRPVTCADAGREGGIRTRGLSVPNAAR